MLYLCLAFAGIACLRVLLRVLQQFNALYFRYKAAALVSLTQGSMDILLMGGSGYVAVDEGLTGLAMVAVSAGIGGSIGMLTGMYLNRGVRG